MLTKEKLLIVAMLITVGCCQRGGGSGSDEYADERWGSDDDYGADKDIGQEDGGSYLWILIFVMAFLGIVYYTYKNPK